MTQTVAAKPTILALQCGGTLEARNVKGNALNHEAQEHNYFHRVPQILERYDVQPMRIGRLDSTDMTHEHRVKIAKAVYDNYDRAEGFLVIHGTDTMAETGASLTYMLQNVGKPVIITGSQVSIYKPGSDAISNLNCAAYAACSDVGEVAIMFGDFLLRGSRTIKIDACGFHSFETPRAKPLGERRVNAIGELEIILENNRLRARPDCVPDLFTDFETKVETYQQTSGSSSNGLIRLAESNDVEGIVLVGFGTGNVQTRLIPALDMCTKNGKPVVIVSSCLRGASLDLYEVGSRAIDAGAICSKDLTREAATQKIMYALGKYRNMCEEKSGSKIDFVKKIIQTPIGGDCSD